LRGHVSNLSWGLVNYVNCERHLAKLPCSVPAALRRRMEVSFFSQLNRIASTSDFRRHERHVTCMMSGSAAQSAIGIRQMSPRTATVTISLAWLMDYSSDEKNETKNQIKFIKQQRAWRLLPVAKTFDKHKTNKRYMYTLLITRAVAFLFIY